MIPTQTQKRGRTVWYLDARVLGAGRITADSRDQVLAKLSDRITGLESVNFTLADRLAKQEAGGEFELLDAVRFYKAHRPGGRTIKLEDALTECVSAKGKRNLRAAYLDVLETNVRQLMATVGPSKLVSEVSTADVSAFLEAQDWASTTVNGVKAKLSAFFAWAIKRGYCAINPVANIEAIVVDREAPRIFTVEQVHRLLDTASVLFPCLLPYLTLGIFCGIRPKELGRDTTRICLERKAVEVGKSKTRDWRIVELSENAIKWLADRPLYYSRHRFEQLIEAARIEWSPDVMRHTFASYHLARYQNADKTAHELGHFGSTRMLHRHYKATVTAEDAEIFWRLEPV